MNSLPKIAAVKPKQAPNKLLESNSFEKDLSQINQLYNEIYDIWDRNRGTEASLYRITEPKLEKLNQELNRLLKKYSLEYGDRARGHVAMAQFQSKSKDFKGAVDAQRKALFVFAAIIDDTPNRFKEAKLSKTAYNYDPSGEIQEGSGSRADQENIADTANPREGHETPRNLANLLHDSEAERDFPQLIEKKKPNILNSRISADTRLSAEEAGYMELAGAKKDADCHKVKVSGGVSLELGCCNKFQPESDKVSKFSCGTCKFSRKESSI
jgi:hypothetical protein